jgi:hypothetical protein
VRQLVGSRTVTIGTEKVGVIVVVAEPDAEAVLVTRGEAVTVTEAVGASEVEEGVNIACNVNAAAVWISLGGGSCSKGIVQARIAEIRIIPARN